MKFGKAKRDSDLKLVYTDEGVRTINNLKMVAKRMNEINLSHAQCLELAAKNYGYNSYAHFLNCIKEEFSREN